MSGGILTRSNFKIIAIIIMMIPLIFTPPLDSITVLAKAQESSNGKYFEYPTETWIIESQDYFGSWIDWYFSPVDGIRSDKRLWNFTWIMQDFVYIENETIDNPLYELREAYNESTGAFDEDVLLHVYNSTPIYQFKNYGDFKSDVHRLDSYPVVPEDKEEFKGLIKRIDILNNDTGSFLVTFKDKWKPGKKITIGFSSTILYSGVSNIIMCEGGTAADPITFWDLWNASNVNGWGVVFRKTNHSYVFNAHLLIDDGSSPTTYFTDEDRLVAFDNNTQIYVNRFGNFTLGRLVDGNDKSTSHGCTLLAAIPAGYFIYMNNVWTSLSARLYGCTIISPNGIVLIQLGIKGRVWGMQFVGPAIGQGTFGSWYRVSVFGGVGIWRIVGGVYEDIVVYNPSTTMYRPVGDVADVKSINPTRDFDIHAPPRDLYFTNCDLEKWNWLWATCVYNMYRRYTVDLKVVNSTGFPLSGGTVILYDKDDSVVFNVTTQADGTIVQQFADRGYYNKTMGDTLVDFSPHELSVSHGGLSHTISNITLEEPIDWTISIPLVSGWINPLLIFIVLLISFSLVIIIRMRGK